jgi:DNA polymerase III epsilon subunit-like protein
MPVRPQGYFDRFLVIDCETSGLNFDHSNPDITDGYQSLSWGLIVSDLKTMKPIDELYVEIKWDGVSKWHHKAEQVHGLSKKYLEENGMDEEDAAIEIAQFIHTYFDVDDTIICMGHNVARFDIPFLKKLLIKHGFPASISHRCLDSSSLAAMTIGTYTSQGLFDELGIKRGDVHNALTDSRATLQACRIIRKMFQSGV